MKTSKYNLFIQNSNNTQYILFNTYSGFISIVKKDTKEILENQEYEKLTEKQFLDFKNKSMIIDDNIDELSILEYQHNKSKFNTESLGATILLTFKCNLNCIYCYEGAGKVNNETLSIEGAKKIINFLQLRATKNNSKRIDITLFGGEPLINFDVGKYILEEMYKYCFHTNKYLSCGIVTNGTLLKNEHINELKKYNCNYIQITLDGAKNVHNTRRLYKDGSGSFDKIIDSLKLLKNRRDFINPVIRVNIDKTNIESTYDLLKYLKEENLNCHRLDFGIVHGNTEACSNFSTNCYVEDDLADILESLWNHAEECGFKINQRPRRTDVFCGMCKESSFTITPNCDLYKCWNHAGIEKHRIGSLNKDGVPFDVQKAYYDWMNKSPYKDTECLKCIYLPSCGGGCSSISYNKNKSYQGEGCFKTKGVVEKQVLRFLFQYNKNIEVNNE
jgi:uncharacterized protein